MDMSKSFLYNYAKPTMRRASMLKLSLCLCSGWIICPLIFFIHYYMPAYNPNERPDFNADRSFRIQREYEFYQQYARASSVEPRNERMPLIFIGGPHKSGTTLLAAMLDGHPLVRCGRESALIPMVLDWYYKEVERPLTSGAFNYAGMTEDVVNAAMSAFILEIITRHGYRAPRFCKKDPYSMVYAAYLAKIFPKAKFLLLIRDARAVSLSRLRNFGQLAGNESSSLEKAMVDWNHEMTLMVTACRAVGPDRCFPVYYEQLVLNPYPNVRAVLEFLEIPWHDGVLHHQDVAARRYEGSNRAVDGFVDTVLAPLHRLSLNRWITEISDDVQKKAKELAPLLVSLGYGKIYSWADYNRTEQVNVNCKSIMCKNRKFWVPNSAQVHLPNSAAEE